jgi:hypothetical protein
MPTIKAASTAMVRRDWEVSNKAKRMNGAGVPESKLQCPEQVPYFRGGQESEADKFT